MKEAIKQRLLIVGLVVAGLGVAVSFPIHFLKRSSPYRSSLEQRELAARVLAEYVASRFPGQKALIISNPFTLERGRSPEIYAYEAAGQTGLKKGFGTAITSQIAYPALRPGARANPNSVEVPRQSTTPLSYLMKTGAWDDLAASHPDHLILASLIGLPADWDQSNVWRSEEGRKIALLLPDWRVLGNRENLLKAFASGKIIAAVMRKVGHSGGESAQPAPSHPEFDEHYLLVTQETIAELVKAYPQQF